jgi:Aldehyde dehydrogenase family
VPGDANATDRPGPLSDEERCALDAYWRAATYPYPAHAAFGGYKVSGVGRENHKMMLDHYSQTKCLLVSYDQSSMGCFRERHRWSRWRA